MLEKIIGPVIISDAICYYGTPPNQQIHSDCPIVQNCTHFGRRVHEMGLPANDRVVIWFAGVVIESM